MKEQSLLKKHLEATCLETKCRYTEDGLANVFVFTTIGGSDSVKLVFDFPADLWYIEIFPINQNDEIVTIHFDKRENAIKAFRVWQTYYDKIVKENFKMF